MSLMTPHLRETEGGRRRWLPRPCLFASHRHAFCDKISSTCELCSLFPTQISISVSPVRSPVGGINLIILSARSVPHDSLPFCLSEQHLRAQTTHRVSSRFNSFQTTVPPSRASSSAPSRPSHVMYQSLGLAVHPIPHFVAALN